MPDTMPFALDAPKVALASGLLIVLGVLGAAGAVRRITSVDPLTALGAQR
jgi:putative ABC transport system permease protein